MPVAASSFAVASRLLLAAEAGDRRGMLGSPSGEAGCTLAPWPHLWSPREEAQW